MLKMENYKLETLNECPLCHQEECSEAFIAGDRLKHSEEKFRLVKCLNCGLVFQNPRVKPEDINYFYRSEYFDKRPTDQKRNQIKSGIVQKYTNGPGSLLEIGSANGQFLHHMQLQGWYVEGVEPSSAGVKNAKEKFDIETVFEGNTIDRPITDIKFDVVTMWAVLPHIHNPIETLKYISKVLKKDGLVVITVVNVESAAAKIMKNNWGHLDQPRHYFMYSPDTVEKLLNQCQIGIKDLFYHDDLWNSNIRFHKIKPLSYLNRNDFLQRVMNKADKIVTRPLNAWFRKRGKGGVMTIVGSKNQVIEQ